MEKEENRGPEIPALSFLIYNNNDYGYFQN